jgi:hypothetical protein
MKSLKDILLKLLTQAHKRKPPPKVCDGKQQEKQRIDERTH